MRPGRLRKGREFDTVYQEGSRASGRFVAARASRAAGGRARVAVVAGKRSFPSSVVRNRVRRRLRSALAGHEAVGVDLIVVARTGSMTAPFADLASDIAGVVRAASRRAGAR